MTRIGILLIAFLVQSIITYGQAKLSTGLMPDDTVYINRKKISSSPVTISGAKPGGKSLALSLEYYIPQVYDQGSQGACTAFAVTEALSIRENYLQKKTRNNKKGKQVLYSPAYLWILENQNRPKEQKCDAPGISFSKAFACVFYNQLVTWANYPYLSDRIDFCHDTFPNEKYKHKITDRRFSFDDVRMNVSSFKNLLQQGYPICISTNVDVNFWKAVHENKGIWDKRGVSLNDEHAMVVVDYNDDKKMFKVLDSHGESKGDHGFIWISYNLVNPSIGLGVISRAYIVSFDKVVKAGPTSNVIRPSSKDLLFNIAAWRIDDKIVGFVKDISGEALPGATIKVNGLNGGTQTNAEGGFTILAPDSSKLNVSMVGYSSTEFDVIDRPNEVYSQIGHVDWTKKGYYRIFNGVRFGVVELNRHDKTVLLSIVDDVTGKELTNNVFLELGEKLSISVKNKTFTVSLLRINHQGKIFNIGNWYAATLHYNLNSDTESLTQYF